MSALGNIIKKELKELLTPSTIIPVIIIALIFGTIGSSMEGIQEGFQEEPILGYINEDDNNLSRIATSYIDNNSDIVFTSSDIADKQYGLEQIKQKEGLALIVIKENFSKNISRHIKNPFHTWVIKLC